MSISVEVIVYADFICPWCYLGMVRLDRLKKALSDDISLQIIHHPFLLYPHIPEAGNPKSAFASTSKPGTGRVLRLEAERENIEINYRQIDRIPSSRSAHRLVTIVNDPIIKNRLVLRIFETYFGEGKDIGNMHCLEKIALESGVSADMVYRFTNSLEGQSEMEANLALARSDFVRQVPSLRIDRKITLPGLQSTSTWERYLRKAASLKQ